MYQIDTLYTLNLNNVLCQLDVNKVGRGEDMRDWIVQVRGLLSVGSSQERALFADLLC